MASTMQQSQDRIAQMKPTDTMTKTPLIAIVDDDDAMRTSLDSLIRSFGFRTLGFSSGEAFLTSDHVRDTACLLLDVRIPRINGLELQSRIVASEWYIPIIFMTSFADDDVRIRALAAGAIDFLYKPFPEGKLLNAIEKALHPS